MTRLALRGLAARKLRTSLTVIAVLLGVTMIAGTFVLTDTIQKAFDEIFASGTKGADVVVSGKEQVETEFTMPRPLDAQVLDEIRQLPEVEPGRGPDQRCRRHRGQGRQGRLDRRRADDRGHLDAEAVRPARDPGGARAARAG